MNLNILRFCPKIAYFYPLVVGKNKMRNSFNKVRKSKEQQAGISVGYSYHQFVKINSAMSFVGSLFWF